MTRKTINTDWTATIRDLRKGGWTEVQLATSCGCTQAAINLIANGKTLNPKYIIGAVLIDLHKALSSKRARPVL